nr:TraM recognition domain-containing protein [Bifidobacterium adolescentis]
MEAAHGRRDPGRARRSAGEGIAVDVDPKLQTNRVADLGRTVRPSSRAAGVALLVALAVMSVFGAICAASGHGFDIFALLYILSGQWEFTGAQWALAGLLVILAGALVGLCWWLLARKVAPKVTGSADRTRVDVYAPSMGHGEAVSKVTRERAEKMASRLVKDYDPKRMEPGYPLGRNIVDGTPMSTSWEDMAIVLAGPRSGKSLCYAIPAVCSAPGPCLATSNKGDILDVTRPVRMHDHPDGRIWVFDPERIAEPNRKHTTWVWNLIDSIHTIADAKRIADCWRYASGQPSTGGDDFFPGTAAQQLADYLFAAHLGGKTVADVFRWASSERNTEPVTILAKHEGYGEIAARVSSVIALTPETRSGVFGSLQTMVAFLADPDVIEWVLPREGDGTPEGRDVFDPLAFATSEGDTLYLLSAQGRPSTALTASLTAVVAFTAFQYAQSECTDNNRRLPRPMCCVLDEAANICRWPELADVYSYFGSAGIPIMTIWQNPDQGKAAFGETNFGSLFNNANILVYLGGIKDAKWLGEISSLVGQREIVRGSLNIDGQGRRSVNNSIQKENILDVSDLAEWPVGRALVLASQCRAQIDRTMPWTENRVWADIIRKAA